MRSLLLLTIATLFATCEGFILVQLHNKCSEDLPIVRINAYNEKALAYTLQRKMTFCEFRSVDPVSYQIGMNGKMRADLSFGLAATEYLLNATAGFDISMSMVPSNDGDIAGKILNCLDQNCRDAVHENSRKPKWYFTKGNTMDITFCPENEKVTCNMKCMGPDYD